MKYWIITDTHFNHRKLEEYSGRPSNFEELIIKNCEKEFKPEDIIIHLGDVCIGKDEEWNTRFTALPGKKILILGNHDRKSTAWYYSKGWDTVCESFGLRFQGNKILFTHEPRENLHGYNLNIHGHWHNNDHRQDPEVMKFYGKFHRLLAIENTKYKPVLLEHLAQRLEGV